MKKKTKLRVTRVFRGRADEVTSDYKRNALSLWTKIRGWSSSSSLLKPYALYEREL